MTYPGQAASFLNSFLPDFVPSLHWTSRLRKRARDCPGFRNLAAYEHTETSDITYEDKTGGLADWLHSLGYPPAGDWADKSVTYYIEVKTTIREFSAPFIMSAGQMEHVSPHLADRSMPPLFPS